MFFFKLKTEYEMRISDWISDVCSSDLYDVAGNTLLDQLAIEKAIYPHLGPAHSEDDVEKARTALEETYRYRGYESVVVEIPQQIGRASCRERVCQYV